MQEQSQANNKQKQPNLQIQSIIPTFGKLNLQESLLNHQSYSINSKPNLNASNTIQTQTDPYQMNHPYFKNHQHYGHHHHRHHFGNHHQFRQQWDNNGNENNFEDRNRERGFRRGCKGWRNRPYNHHKHHKNHQHSSNSQNGSRSSSSSCHSKERVPKKYIQKDKSKKEFDLNKFWEDLLPHFGDFQQPIRIQLKNLNEYKKQQLKKICQIINIGDLNDYVNVLRTLIQVGYYNLGILKLTKVILNKKYQYQRIINKLNQQISVLQKIKSKQNKLYQMFPNPSFIQYLEKDKLMKLSLDKTIFLVDGNNCLGTIKRLKKYFFSQNVYNKAESQVRFNWLLSTSNAYFYLFFDDKFQDQIYQTIIGEIEKNTNQYQFNRQNQQQPIYAGRNLNQLAEADTKILQKLFELHHKIIEGFESNKEIVLISSDRILAQKCMEIHEIKQSGGKQFCKFIKKSIKNKYYGNLAMKGIIKRIMKCF